MQKELPSTLSSIPQNARLMLQLVRAADAPITRADLSRSAGLSPAAVTNLVNGLLEEGLVEEHAAAPPQGSATRVGRPATRLGLAARGRAVLALQLGSGTIQVAVSDLEANVLASESLTYSLTSTPEEGLGLAVDALRRVTARAGVSQDQLIGLGVGAAGLVDRSQRINLVAHNQGWSRVPIADHLERELGIPTVVDHNVRAMAVGESRYGLGRGLESLAFVYCRTGVGAGLILGGAAYRGGTHGAAEIGHLRATSDGLPCVCGRTGCLETVLSDRVLNAQVAEFLPSVRAASESVPADPTWARGWAELVLQGDERAVALLERTASYLAAALVDVVHLLNPQLIVLGGLLEEISDVLLGPLRAQLAARVLPELQDDVRVEATGFRGEAGLIGAASVALDRFLFGPPLIAGAAAH